VAALVPLKNVFVPKRQLLGKLFGQLVYAIDGEHIRGTVDVDFVEGGNHARYAYVPAGEIWVEKTMSPLDVAATVLHELTELTLMARGMDYEEAHDHANVPERMFRKEFADSESVDLEDVASWMARHSPSGGR
jgi:hypothetical protein